MEMQLGKVEVLLLGLEHRFSAGELFEIAANASFKVKALSPSDYYCSFID